MIATLSILKRLSPYTALKLDLLGVPRCPPKGWMLGLVGKPLDSRIEAMIPQKEDKSVVKISLYCPPKYSSHDKIDAFFPPPLKTSPLMMVSDKRFPKGMAQFKVRPWPNQPEYQYYICLKFRGHIPIHFREIHEHPCLIQFRRQGDDIEADLYVKMD